MKKTLLSIFLVTFIFSLGQAQSLYSTRYDSLFSKSDGYIPSQVMVDSLNPRKALWIPIVEAIGMNIALGAFNRYVMNSEFAYINGATIKHNFEGGFSTDADAFSGNMWSHPFHGSIYYNMARSSGYNYWTSLGVGAIASWQWEFFMENEPPAFNDWIMTSVAGSMFGEVFYRFSNMILDENLSGSSRVWNEIGAGIFNPGRLFNRLIYGRTARVTPKKLYEKRPFLGELGFGINNVADGTDLKNGQRNGLFTMDFAYGNVFSMRKFKPFDFFRFRAGINFGGLQPPIGEFRIYAILAGNTSRVGEDGRFLWGIFNHYDYLENNVYQVGGVSVGPGVGYRTSHKESTQYIGMFHVAALLMGGANSDYSEEYKVAFLDSARTYNMGPGAHIKMENIVRFSFGSFYLGYNFWWIHTWDGAPGDEFITMIEPKIRIHVYKTWHVGLEWRLYHRFGRYEQFPNVDMRNNEQRLFVAYSF